MNEAGVLGRFIPDFGRVVGLMQFSMYHHYTIDEHLLRTVGVLSQIEAGALKEEHPLVSEIAASYRQSHGALSSPRSCTTSPKDVPRIIRPPAPRSRAAFARAWVCRRPIRERVAWLVEQHLTMSNMAQGRDLADPRTAESLAAIVQTLERLRMLLDADGVRHPRGRTRRVERLEGPIVAHAVLGDRSRARRRALGDRPQVPRAGGPRGAAARAARLVRPRFRRLRATPLPRLLAESRSGAPGRARQIALCDGRRGALAGDGIRDRRLPRRHRTDDRRARPPAPALDYRRRLRGRRRQYRRRADFHHHRRFRPRHHFRLARFRSRRGRTAARQTDRAHHRAGVARRNSRQRNHLRQERARRPGRAPSRSSPR